MLVIACRIHHLFSSFFHPFNIRWHCVAIKAVLPILDKNKLLPAFSSGGAGRSGGKGIVLPLPLPLAGMCFIRASGNVILELLPFFPIKSGEGRGGFYGVFGNCVGVNAF